MEEEVEAYRGGLRRIEGERERKAGKMGGEEEKRREGERWSTHRLVGGYGWRYV